MKNKFLIIAAHPDDEVLGCFGTAARLINEGFEGYTLILGEGKTSRAETAQSAGGVGLDKASEKLEFSRKFSKDSGTKLEFSQEIKHARQEFAQEMQILEQECAKANELIGVREVFRANFADNRFDSAHLLDIVKAVEKVVREVRPSVIFTHYEKDLNIDHQMAFKAALTATRCLKGQSVREFYSFEVISSTEFNYPLSFCPNFYFDISTTLQSKIQAMSLYKSELCEFPHPRSLENIELNAKYHGVRVGVPYAEEFLSVRVLR